MHISLWSFVEWPCRSWAMGFSKSGLDDCYASGCVWMLLYEMVLHNLNEFCLNAKVTRLTVVLIETQSSLRKYGLFERKNWIRI